MKFRLIIDKESEESVTAVVHGESELTDKIRELVEGDLPEGDSTCDRNFIVAYEGDNMRTLSFEEIECVTVSDGKTFAVDKEGKKLRIRQKLYEAEEILPEYFFRINKSAIANRKRIKMFKTGFDGAVDAVFKSGYKDYVSRRCFAEIKRRYK